MSISLKLISSYNKCFSNGCISDLTQLNTANALKNDMFAFQAALTSTQNVKIKVDALSELSDYITIYQIKETYVQTAAYSECPDTDYLNNKQPGLYPDIMIPVTENTVLDIPKGSLYSFWIQMDIPQTASEGTFDITFKVIDENNDDVVSETLKLEIIDAILPDQKLIYTNWLHADCLASYYNVEVFSDRHWEIIDEYMKTAAKNGVNMLLTPVFTPPLDTAIGGERPTVQLVGVKKHDESYLFDFTLLDKWIAMAQKNGIKYFEISHLFTQWGALHAAKIIADCDGLKRRIFGWETDSLSDEYINFLREFITKLKAHMATLGLLNKMLIHFSDEPAAEHLETFKEIRRRLSDVVEGCMSGDALSDYSFYKTGAVSTPIVGTDHLQPFIDNGVEDLWCYTCCAEHVKVSNRFIAMSMNRNRVIGMQMYKYNIVGCLHWGFNFYYSRYSTKLIDPYVTNNGTGGWVPSGDAFSVYPADDGTALPSLHLLGFTQALYDMRALSLLESLTSKYEVNNLIDNVAQCFVTFEEFPRNDSFCEDFRFEVNKKIKKILKG